MDTYVEIEQRIQMVEGSGTDTTTLQQLVLHYQSYCTPCIPLALEGSGPTVYSIYRIR